MTRLLVDGFLFRVVRRDDGRSTAVESGVYNTVLRLYDIHILYAGSASAPITYLLHTVAGSPHDLLG